MSDWKNAGYSPRESGAYPPGAEFDPRAPWNQEDPPEIECKDCEGTGKMSGCCEQYPVRILGKGYKRLHGRTYKCSCCGRFTSPVDCEDCHGHGFREANADEMDKMGEDRLAQEEEQADRFNDERRGRG